MLRRIVICASASVLTYLNSTSELRSNHEWRIYVFITINTMGKYWTSEKIRQKLISFSIEKYKSCQSLVINIFLT